MANRIGSITGSSDVEELVKQWTEVFNTEVLQYATPNEASDEEVYANIYHSLAHSPLAATMIQLEHSHASAVTKTDELVSTSNSEDDWVGRKEVRLGTFTLDKKKLSACDFRKGFVVFLMLVMFGKYNEENFVNGFKQCMKIRHLRPQIRIWEECQHPWGQ